jgi:hypothetical protein
VIFSDYQDLVMDLIRLNMKESEPKSKDCQLLAAKLDWCEANKEDFYG